MTKGGARNRSGPPIDPDSARSDARGIVLTALPAEGHQGEIPEFPLPAMLVRRWVFEDKRRWQELDEDATVAFREREVQLWSQAWRYPQACVWALHPWRWTSVAMWVRTFVVCESDDATAADKGSLHRFADQIGLTPAGLKENGWKIAEDETARRRTAKPASRSSAKQRMQVVRDGTEG